MITFIWKGEGFRIPKTILRTKLEDSHYSISEPSIKLQDIKQGGINDMIVTLSIPCLISQRF